MRVSHESTKIHGKTAAHILFHSMEPLHPGAHTENWDGTTQSCPLCDQQSSVTSKLDHLEWETLESRQTKNQLVMFFKIIHGLIDIPAERFLTPASIRTRSHHSLKYRQVPPSSDYHKYSFFLIQYVSGFPPSHCGWGSLFGTFQTGAL